MKVMIGYPTGEFGRRVDFYDFMNQLEVPCDQLRITPHGQSPAKARNIIFEQALLNNCSHVFLVDDDMALQPDTLVKLLAHDKDIVSGLYLQRSWPHRPIAFSEFGDKGQTLFVHLDENTKGLIPVVATGFGCCLIKTSVLKKISRPWVQLGNINPEEWCDDINFFWKIHNEAPETEIFLDTEVRPGHMGSMILWAHRDGNNNWFTSYDASGNQRINIPRAGLFKSSISGIDQAAQIEGWMSLKELQWLADTARDKNLIIEFGSHCGRSTRALADNAPENARIIAVDPWTGEYFGENGAQVNILNGSRFADFQANLRDYILNGKVLPIKKLSTEFEPTGDLFDFIFIDGDHRYDIVKADIQLALNDKMSHSETIISGHDYDCESWPDVARAVDEIFGKENVNIVDSIWWVKKGAR